jgi:hypothetical protein
MINWFKKQWQKFIDWVFKGFINNGNPRNSYCNYRCFDIFGVE